jgi:hypothetical protein
MRYRLSIFYKLLLVIIPLVCTPVAVVGYLSIQASVDRVNRLVRQEQMVTVEAAAKRINDVFYNCRIDLDTITRLPVLGDFQLARSFRLRAEAEFNRQNLLKLFNDILARTPYYYRIRFLNKDGTELIHAPAGSKAYQPERRAAAGPLKAAFSLGPGGLFFSELVNSPQRRGFVIYCAKPFYSGWRKLTGVVVIDLDFEKIIQMIRSIQVGSRGYAFLLDDRGRSIVHPTAPPYMNVLKEFSDPGLIKLTRDMTAGAPVGRPIHTRTRPRWRPMRPSPS